MALSNTTILSIVELPVYLLLLPFVVYLGYRHGKSGLLGYLYLAIACVLRIVSDVVSISERDQSTSIAAIVVSSLGLSPLLLSLAGFLHEIHLKLLTTTTTTKAQHRKAKRWMRLVQVQIHSVAVVGISLIVTGSVQLASATTIKIARNSNDLREAGAVLLLVLWMSLALYAGLMLFWSRRISSRVISGILGLTSWTFGAALLIGIKIMYAVIYTFDHTDAEISPVTGRFVYKVVLVVSIQLLAVMALSVGGWTSLGLAGEVEGATEDHEVSLQKVHSTT